MKYISRILFVLAVLFVGGGTVQAQSDDLKIVKNATGVTIETYVSSTEPGTSYSASGTEAENVQHDQYLVLKVTPAEGKWLYNEMLEVQVAGSPGGSLDRTRGVVVAEAPTALSSNQADGTGYYYFQIPSGCTAANSYKNVIVTGTAIEKIDLSAATIDGTGKVITKTTDSWTATITLDEISWTYNKNTHCPAISAFSLTNGTKTFSNTTKQVAISGTETNAGSYNAALSAVTGGCFLNSLAVPFTIEKVTTEITINEGNPEWGGVLQLDVNDTFGPVATLNPAEAGNITYTITYTLSTSVVPVVTIGEDGMLTALAEGTVTITASFAGSDNYAAAESKSITAKVSLINSSVSVDNEVVNLLVGETHTVIPTTTPDGLNVTYVPDDSGVASIDADGKITALKEGTAIIIAKVGGDGVYAESTATVNVNVSKVPTEITIANINVELKVNEEVATGATLTPTEAGSLTYTPNDPSIAIVADGKIKGVGVGTTTITVSYAGNQKYSAAESKTITVHVTKILTDDNIVLDIPTGGYIYDATPKTPAVTVKYGEKTLTKDIDYTVSYSNNVNAGDNTASVTVTDIAGGDYDVSGTKTFSIAQAPLTVTAVNQSLVYNGSAQGEDNKTYTNATDIAAKVSVEGLQGSDALTSITLNGTKKDKDVYANTIEPSAAIVGTATNNYEITYVSGTLTISAKPLKPESESGGTLKVDISPDTKVYNGEVQTPTITLKDGDTTISPEDYTVTYKKESKVAETKNVGDYDVVIESKSTANYTFSTTGTFSITKASLTVTANDKSIAFGEAAANAGVKYDTFVGSDDESSLDGKLTYSYKTNADGTGEDYKTTSPKGKYYIIPSGLTSTNYEITFVEGTLTVGAKNLTSEDEGGTLKVDISPDTKVYNGEVQTPTITLKDGDTTISPEDYTVTYKKESKVAETKNVGDYDVVIESKSTANYTFSTTGTFSITKALLTVTAGNQAFVYDGSAQGEDNKTYTNATDIAAKVSVTGLQGSDALTSITLNGTKEHKGIYADAIVPSAAIVGTATDNYDIKYVSGTLTIGEKALTVTITGKTDTKTYSGAVQSVTGYTIDIPDGATLTEDDIVGPTKAASGKDVKSTDDGKYMMGLVAGDFSTKTADYAVTFIVTDGWLKITPAALTITANDMEKAAGVADPELEYTSEGLKEGDAISGTLERTVGETVGTYAISQGDLSAGDNYTLTFNGANFVIYRAIDDLFAEGCEWATFVANEDLDIPEGLQAYVVTAIEGTTVVITTSPYIAKGVGFLLKRSDKSVNSFKGYAFSGTATSVPESLLTGSATAATDIQMYKDFVLYNDNFELAGVSSVGQWHAYLPASALGGAAGSRRLTIIGDDTGISNIVLDDTDDDGVWYSIDGRRLQAKPTKKGLYIHKGKTTVIK